MNKAPIHFLYNFLLKPHSLNEDDYRKEFITDIILLISVTFLTVLEVILIIQYLKIPDGLTADFINPLIFSCVYFFFIGLYTFSRRGYFKASAYTLVFLYILATTYAAWRWGPDLYQVVVSYALIITISGIVINSRFSFISALFIGIVITLTNYLDLHGLISVDRGWKNESLVIDDTIEIGLTYLMIAFISWLSNREIDRSLKRAHRSEADLKRQNESLEEIVENRTQELRQTQAEKVSQLYRFAEFGRLSSGIFHDLINPLSAVTINVQELGNELHPKIADLKSYLDRAVSASRRMDQFVSVVKKQIQTTELNEFFSLNKEVQESIMLLDFKARKEKVSIEFEDKEDIKSFGNSLKFQQITTNLIANAIDSYKDTASSSERTVRIKLFINENQINLEVKDGGSGIDPKILSKIFDPFFTTKAEQGVGLGLSTIKETAEKNFGGTIKVESQKGKGSVFTITFPIRRTL